MTAITYPLSTHSIRGETTAATAAVRDKVNTLADKAAAFATLITNAHSLPKDTADKSAREILDWRPEGFRSSEEISAIQRQSYALANEIKAYAAEIPDAIAPIRKRFEAASKKLFDLVYRSPAEWENRLFSCISYKQLQSLMTATPPADTALGLQAPPPLSAL